MKTVIGAVIGDIVGSIYEFRNHRSKDFPLFGKDCRPTDDSIMTLAVAKALKKEYPDFSNLGQTAVKYMQELGRPYPDCGFGGRFCGWIYSEDPEPYMSCGNGSAMRISAVPYFAKDLEECHRLAAAVTEVSHNHPEGIKGAIVTASAGWLALHGASKEEIKEYCSDFYFLHFTLDEIRPYYKFNEICQTTVPEAIVCFLESESFEDAIRNAISIGGDSDTIAAISGGIAEAFYGVPEELKAKAEAYLDERLYGVYKEVNEFILNIPKSE